MDERSHRAGTAARAERTIPWIVSLALHATVVVAAFFIVWSVRPAEPDDRPPVYVSFEAPAPPPAPAPSPAKPDASDAASRSAPAPMSAAIAAQPEKKDGAAPPPAILAETPPRPTPSIESAPRPDVVFSGMGASNARDVVYVVDASGSMVTTFPEVKAELRRSIDALHPTQRFQVLLFTNKDGASFLAPDVPRGVRRPVLLDATRRNKAAVYQWIDKIDPGGRSDPLGALEVALRMKPDAVFLLATRITGPEAQDFDPAALLARLDELNPVNPRTGRRPVAIMAIQILDEDPLGVMSSIGRIHGGQDGYRFISREEFNARRNGDGRAPGASGGLWR